MYMDRGYTSESAWYGYAIMRDKNTNGHTCYVYVTNAAISGCYGIAVLDLAECEEIENAQYYAFGRRGPVIYYATDTDIYRVNYDLSTQEVVSTSDAAWTCPAGETITSVRMFVETGLDLEESADSKYLLVSTYNGSEGKLYVLGADVVSGTLSAEPLETFKVTISRAKDTFTFPAKFTLIAAMNPCRCGYLGRPDKECSRAPQCGREYLQKISGPLLDRIDIYVDVPDITVSDFQASAGEPSTSIRERVTRARDIQRIRYGNNRTNSEVRGNELEGYLTDEAKQILLACVEKGKISARGYYRIMKVARTLADLEQCSSIGATHISEALSYRRTI